MYDTSSQHNVHFKYLTILFVNYTSSKKKKTTNQNSSHTSYTVPRKVSVYTKSKKLLTNIEVITSS